MKIKAVVIGILSLSMVACDVKVSGTSEKPDNSGQTVTADPTLKVGTNEFLENLVQLNGASPNGATHKWTWTAPRGGLATLRKGPSVWIGCEGNPFHDLVTLRTLGFETTVELPEEVEVIQGQSYEVAIQINPNSCMGGAFTLEAALQVPTRRSYTK